MATLLPVGVDLERFVPVGTSRRQALRGQYGLDARPLLLHVGHIRRSRGLETLGVIRRHLPHAQGLVVGSVSMPQDLEVPRTLESAGIVVWRRHFEHIEQVYQLADCYVFPTSAPWGCIKMPLSVLEAMACNLPVMAHPFGVLPEMFRERGGLAFARGDQFVARTREALAGAPAATRAMVAPYAWPRVVDRLLWEMGEVS